jgi:hypothetical protein
MKSSKWIGIALLLSMAGIAHANKAEQIPACEKIVKACESSGFKAGDHKKNHKGLWVDCVGAIAKGQSVEGVTATADEAKACKEAAKAARHHR